MLSEIYRDTDNKLRDMLLEEDYLVVITKEEFELYKSFIESDGKEIMFDPNCFGDRIRNKEHMIHSMLSPFFYDERFTIFERVKDISLKISFDGNSYETTTISLNEHLYISDFDSNWNSIFSLIVKYLNNNHGFKINAKRMQNKASVLKDPSTSSQEEIFIPKSFVFKVEDISILTYQYHGKWRSYMSFDDLLMCPAKFIANNEKNKKILLSIMKHNGLGMDFFVSGMVYSENEIRKYVLPNIIKSKQRLLFSEDIQFIMKLLLTQSHMSDELIFDIIEAKASDSKFITALKNNKMILNRYKNRPSVLLFITVK